MATTAELCKTRGNQAVQAGDFDGAIFQYSEGLKAEPENHVLLSNRAIARLRKKQYEEALQDASEATRLKPDYSKAHTTRGDALYHLNRAREAIAAYEAALRVCPEESREALRQKLSLAESLRAGGPGGGGGVGGGAGGRGGVASGPAEGGGGAIDLSQVPPLRMAQEGGRFVALLCLLGYAVSGVVLPAGVGAASYSLALLLGVVLNVWRVLYDCGPVQWSPEFAQRALNHTATFSALTALTFLAAPPLLLVFVPVFVFEFALLFLFLHDVALRSAPHVASTLNTVGEQIGSGLTANEGFGALPRAQKLSIVNQALRHVSAQMMLGIGVVLVLNLFGPSRSFLVLMLHWQQIRFQYGFDFALRDAFTSTHQSIDSTLAAVPALQAPYRSFANFVASFDPRAQNARRAQAAGGAAGAAGILQQLQSCTVA
jgi:hypothetical protein